MVEQDPRGFLPCNVVCSSSDNIYSTVALTAIRDLSIFVYIDCVVLCLIVLFYVIVLFYIIVLFYVIVLFYIIVLFYV